MNALRSTSRAWVVLFALLGVGCSKWAGSGPGEGLAIFSASPRWTSQTLGAASIELPGRPELQTQADGGTNASIARVERRDADYEFALVDFPPGVLEGSQNRVVINQALDTVMVSRGSVTIDSELEHRIEAGSPGITWPARDLVLRTADGKPCEVRELFVRDSLFLLSACRARDDVSFEPWRRMRDSLKVFADPLPAGASSGHTSDFLTDSPGKKATLRQKSGSGELCTVACEVEGTSKWTTEAPCMGTAIDLHFVADDCERSVTFRTTALRSDESSDATPFIFVYAREKLDYQVTGAALRPTGVTNRRVSHPITGLGNSIGEKPKYAVDGKSITFETLDHRQQTVPLFAEPKRKRK